MAAFTCSLSAKAPCTWQEKYRLKCECFWEFAQKICLRLLEFAQQGFKEAAAGHPGPSAGCPAGMQLFHTKALGYLLQRFILHRKRISPCTQPTPCACLLWQYSKICCPAGHMPRSCHPDSSCNSQRVISLIPSAVIHRRILSALGCGLCTPCVQMVNVTFWLTPHVHILLTSCGWFGNLANASGVIQWTMWNTVSLLRCCDALNARHMQLFKREKDAQRKTACFCLITDCLS